MSNPAMIALIGANPALGIAMSTYDSGSYTGGVPTNQEPERFSFDALMIIPIFFFLFLMSMAITILVITWNIGDLEGEWNTDLGMGEPILWKPINKQ